MKKLISLSILSVTLLGGCRVAVPHEDVFVLDVTQSIDADAEQQMFATVQAVAGQLRRGDTLTIVPITGNAVAELQGRTLHYALPSAEDGQAYDADLRTLRAQIHKDLDRLHADATAHPEKHTDILGTIRVAMKEFSGRTTDKRLVVLSDFIQEDQQFNFRRDPRLGREATASTLGKALVSGEVDHSKVSIVLGHLRSTEFSALAPTRQRAINAFWGQLMPPAVIDSDGTAAVLRAATSK